MVSLRDIAVEAGVSEMTVSNVVHNRGRVGEAKRRKVMELVRNMGYRPNRAARSIRYQRFDAAGLLLSTDLGRSYLPNPLLSGIHDSLAARSMHLVLSRLPDEQLSSPLIVPSLLEELTVDGLLINYTHAIPKPLIEMIQKHSLPAVWINANHRYDCVRPDDFGLAAKATKYLVELGHRRIALADLGVGRDQMEGMHYSRHERVEGYRQTMAELGLSGRIIQPETLRQTSAELLAWAVGQFSGLDRPTATIMQGGYRETHAVLEELKLKVPDDMSMVFFGETQKNWGRHHLTMASVDEAKLGSEAVDMLIGKINGPRDPVPSLVLPIGHIVPGETCRPLS